MKKLYFVVGSQDLYGDECLKQVAADAREMADFLAEKLEGIATVELLPTVENSEICIADMRKASCDDDCIGVITWMHTFSPAKMWIKGLQELRKPLVVLDWITVPVLLSSFSSYSFSCRCPFISDNFLSKYLYRIFSVDNIYGVNI